MSDLKIIIPMAGAGKRFGELTERRPKALVRLADGRLIDHVLRTFQGLEKAYAVQYHFIIGYLGEQITEYLKETHSDKNITYYVQEELMGQSHALYLAKDALSGPTLVTYCDTINETDFSFLPPKAVDGIASVHKVEDPERFGVAVIDPDDLITKLVEKPKTKEYRLALTGLYYFSEGRELIKAIKTQIESGTAVNHEYYLADAINILIANGMRIRTQEVSHWLDAGTPEALLEVNAWLLRRSHENGNLQGGEQSNVLIPPVYIHESVRFENSIIGPNVSIGKNCSINRSVIKNTIIDDDSTVSEATLEDSLIGKGCCIRGNSTRSIVGDHSRIGPA